MNRSRTVITALCLMSVLALGACSGDDPQPKFADPTQSAPTSPSTTPVSGPVEPTMPAAAQGTDADAAEAFVEFYWEMAGYAQRTGDVSSLRALSTESCDACEAGISAIESVYRQGGRLLGGGSVVRTLDSSAVDGGPRNAVHVTARITNDRQELDYPGMKKDEVFPQSTVTTRFIVELLDGSWSMAYWDTKS